MEPLVITEAGDHRFKHQESLFSPDTNEFLHLERTLQIREDSDKFPGHGPGFKDGSDGESLDRLSGNTSLSGDNLSCGRMSSNSSLNGDTSSSSGRVSFRRVELSYEESAEEAELAKKQFQSELEFKLEERKKSIDAGGDGETALQLMERRQLRQFSRADEYLYAMKEDLSEWFNMLYPGIDIDADNFMDRLETGEHLIRHANSVRAKAVELLELIAEGKTKQKPPTFKFPESDLPCRWSVQPGTWFARDNVYNFIKFCRILGVMQCVMFETEDLVCRKNEKHVILTILEVARRGAKIGMLAPMLVQFEQEIDREIAREERERKREERKEEERRRKKEEHELQQHQQQAQANSSSAAAAAAAAAALANAAMHSADMYNSLAVEIDEDREMADVEDNEDEDHLSHDEIITESETEEEEEEDEDYAFPIGPLPQMVTNDLKSLDEMVRELVSECQCPTQFPMIRVSEGKYRIGDTKVLIFVRILRNHVMVRVGGGWDTLQHYLDKHDPCRCRAGHKGTVGASYTMSKNGKSSLGGAICYDRSDSPGTPARRSSTSNLAVGGGMGSRRNSNSTISPSPRPSLQDGYASPRGSTPNVFGNKSPAGNKNVAKTGLGRSESPSVVNYGKSAASSLTSNGNGGVGGTGTRSRSMIKSSGSDLSLGGGKISRENSRQYIATSTSLQNRNLVSRGSSSLFSERSNSSSSLGGHHSLRVGSEGLSRETIGGPLSNCDSSSEVSDEGYKSSHGGSKAGEGATTSTIRSNSQHSSQADQNMTDRPESSLTVASECSSTISSSDSEHGANSISPASESALASPEPPNNQILLADDDSESWPEPPEPLQTLAVKPTTNTNNSTTNNNGKMRRLANTLSNIKIPKFKGASLSRQSSCNASDSETLSPPSPSRSVGSYGDWSTTNRAVSRSRSVSSDTGDMSTLSPFRRGTNERHSYRVPSATSRYMQAAEAYTASARAARQGRTISRPSSRQSQTTPTGRGTWSARTSRERVALTADTYKSPYGGIRTASASPGPNRRQRKISSSSSNQDVSGNQSRGQSKVRQPPLSTQSTPSKKPDGSARRSSREITAELETDDDAILKRMEEILMTYKSKVEDHLAAEGRELPSDIFEDFTTQWVNEASHLNQTIKGNKSRSSSSQRGYSPVNGSQDLMMPPSEDHSRSSTPVIRTLPVWRKEYRDGQRETKIPVPTFYNSPIPSETNI